MKAGNVQHADKIWRILIGLSLVPAIGTLYARLTLPESTKYELTQAKESDASIKEKGDKASVNEHTKEVESSTGSPQLHPVEDDTKHHVVAVQREHYQEFLAYFSHWPHLKVLLGTTLGWFLVDIAFYGINVRSPLLSD